MIRRAATACALLTTLLGPACGDDEGALSGTDTRDAAVLTGAPDATIADTSAPADTTTSAPADTTTTAPGDTGAATSADTGALTDTGATDTGALDDTGPVADSAVADSAVADGADAPDASVTCLRLAPGHRRHVVVSRPYSEPDGDPSPRWDIFPLTDDGALGARVASMDLGRATDGMVAFRADGALGVTAHEDGTIGLFALDTDGQPTVLAPVVDTGAYVGDVVVEDDRLLLVDGNWPDNGGGIYAAALGCDGSVAKAVRLYPTKLAERLIVRGDRHLVAAAEAVTTTPGALHLVAPSGAGWTRVAGADLFGDADAILSALALTADGRYALVGDNSFFSEAPNRVGVGALGVDTIGVGPVVTPLEDPVAIVTSPYDDAALVVSGFGDDVHVLGYDPDADPPFVDEGPPAYTTQRPQLPGAAMRVGGAFPDLVFVVENQAIRRFRFEGDGTVTDLGRTALGDALDAIPGALGVQP